MKDKDRKAVLGRLAASETVSMLALGQEATAQADREAAIRRMIADLGAPILQAKVLLTRLQQHLQASDLTINFVAYKFFNTKPQGTGYVSQFEGGSKWGDGGYIRMRDEAEEAMFDYSSGKPKPASAPQAVINRIRHLGKASSVHFEPAMRPKYAALNYARLDHGSAGQWGKSFIVLKEHVKHTASYLHTDSFDEAGSPTQRAAMAGKLSTFTNLDRLIANMPLPMLKALHAAEKGVRHARAMQVPGLGSTSYIETHVHGEVRFDRDIAKVVLSNAEIAESLTKTTALEQQGKPFRAISSDKLVSIFTKFSAKYGITVQRI